MCNPQPARTQGHPTVSHWSHLASPVTYSNGRHASCAGDVECEAGSGSAGRRCSTPSKPAAARVWCSPGAYTCPLFACSGARASRSLRSVALPTSACCIVCIVPCCTWSSMWRRRWGRRRREWSPTLGTFLVGTILTSERTFIYPT